MCLRDEQFTPNPCPRPKSSTTTCRASDWRRCCVQAAIHGFLDKVGLSVFQIKTRPFPAIWGNPMEHICPCEIDGCVLISLPHASNSESGVVLDHCSDGFPISIIQVILVDVVAVAIPVKCHSRRGTVPIKLGHDWGVAVLQIAWERVVDFCFIPSGSHYFTLFVCHDRALLVWATGRKRGKGPVPRLCHTLRVLLCMCYLARDIGNVQQVGAEARSASPSRSKTGCIMHIRGLRHARDKQVGPSQSAVPLDLHHFSSIHFLERGGWVKNWKGLLYEMTERDGWRHGEDDA